MLFVVLGCLPVVELSAKPVTALVWTMRLRDKYKEGGVGQRLYIEGLSVILAMASKGMLPRATSSALSHTSLCMCCVAASNIPNMFKEGCFDIACEAAVGKGLDVLSDEQAYLSNSILEVMIENGALHGLCASALRLMRFVRRVSDLSQVIRKRAIKEGVFLKSLHRMHENNLGEQIKQALRVLGRLAGASKHGVSA